MTKILENIEKYILYILVAIYPVFVLSIFSNAFVIPKEVLLVVFSGLAILVWIIKIITKGEFTFSAGKFDLGVLFVLVAYLVSAIIRTPNKMDAFLFPGNATFVIASCILYFLINQLDKKSKEGFSLAILFSSVILAISVLFVKTGLFAKIPQLPSFVKDADFNALGGMLSTVIYLSIAFVFSFGLILKQKDIFKRLFIGVSLVIVLLGLAVSVKSVLPGGSQAAIFPDVQTSWVVGVETLKESPIWGVGPSNYLTAFNRFKPLAYNQTDLWQTRFATAHDFYLTLLTETGFAGVFALLILLSSIYKGVVKGFKFSAEKLSLFVLLVLFAIFPVSLVLVVLLFVILGLLSDSEEKNKILFSNSTSKVPTILMSLPVLAALVVVGFFGVKILIAENTFQNSLNALSKSDAKSTYDLMTKAINQNPSVDRYHASLAQVNMALASSLASKKDLTDDDKKTITQLVQQAINEGKSTVILNPQRSGNWEFLAGIYRSIMSFAQGADQFTIQTYTQAVALDPTNPDLRIALGGVYYALGRYDEAIEAFKLAVLAKSDLANAHYNLAAAYREKKDFDKAIAEMNTVLSLVKKDSEDYTLAVKTLDELQKSKPVAASTTKAGEGQDLTAPQPIETSNVKPPITLPQDATPPVTP